MPDPYNYFQGFQQPDLASSFTQGIQLGEMARQRELEQMKLRQQIMLAEQQKKEREAMQGELLSVAENPTLEDIRRLVIKHPSLSAPYKEVMSSLSEDQQAETKKQGWNVFTALTNGRKDLAIEILSKAEQSARNAGKTAQADGAKLQRELLEKPETGEAGDRAVMLGAGTFLASIDPTNYDKYMKSQIEAAKAPAELAKTKAETEKLKVETENLLNPPTKWEGFHAAEGPGGPGIYQYSPKGEVRKVPGLKPIPQTMMMVGATGAAGADAAKNYAERLVKGLEDWPSTVSIRSDPTIVQGIKLAREMDPTFNSATHKQRQQVQKAFTTGKPADTINALNTGMGHLSELSDLAEQLNNTNYMAANKAKNWAAKQSGDPIISSFETTQKAVADEVTRVWRGTGGSERDVQEALANLSHDLSPAQLRSNIYQLTKLMASKQKALEDQYKKGMGKFGELEVLNEEAQTALDKIKARASGKKAQAPQQRNVTVDY